MHRADLPGAASRRSPQRFLYELEIAFLTRSSANRVTPPWLIDRIFRNLLTDATGQHSPRRILHR
ncbi:MAG: transglutaminase family protein [Nibricoccus sp.]